MSPTDWDCKQLLRCQNWGLCDWCFRCGFWKALKAYPKWCWPGVRLARHQRLRILRPDQPWIGSHFLQGKDSLATFPQRIGASTMSLSGMRGWGCLERHVPNAELISMHKNCWPSSWWRCLSISFINISAVLVGPAIHSNTAFCLTSFVLSFHHQERAKEASDVIFWECLP